MLLEILPIVPLVITALAIFPMRKGYRYMGYASLAASLLSLLVIAYIFLYVPEGMSSMPWFAVGGFTFSIATSTFALNKMLLLLVGIITPLILTYSIGFMDVLSEQPRYYFEMLVFASSMMLFSVAANLILIFLAWEMLGITSYLLIGFWYHKPNAPGAARKAITTILIGDVALLAAIVILWNAYHTMNIYAILSAPSGAALPFALILILVAAFTKSAQFPFHEWLSDAMEGPTPVSAFLHSSTMVKAGVFLIAVLLPLFAHAGLLWVLVSVGLVTAAIGAANALTSHHIKKILAYSTIEDLALMFVALGLNAILAAMLFFIVQAFYKALLFMSAGSMMKANNGEEDIYKIYGSYKNKLLLATAAIGAISLAGVFPLSGFFGKVAIDTSAANNFVVYAVISIIELASSLYIFRWLFIPARKPAQSKDFALGERYSHLPKTMLAPAVVLAALVFIGSAAYFMLPSFIVPTQYVQIPYGLRIGVLDAAIETVLVALGLYFAYYLFRKGNASRLPSKTPLRYLLYNSPAVNRFYDYVVAAAMAVARGFYRADFSIYSVIKAGARGLLGIDDGIRLSVNGQVNRYLMAFIIGLILLVLFLAI